MGHTNFSTDGSKDVAWDLHPLIWVDGPEADPFVPYVMFLESVSEKLLWINMFLIVCYS
jgi:hypothetical protein